MYADADTNLRFVRQVLADAQSGDAEARFLVFSALDYCERSYPFYFVRGAKRRTLDEALVWAARSPGTSAEEAREVHRRCQDLMEDHANEFGHADDWLALAAEAGHPAAQLERAERLLLGAMTAQVDRNDLAQARSYLLQGLKRHDPGAVWRIGDLQKPLTGTLANADKDQWIWRLAACKLGYDCSTKASWYQFMCRFDYNCQPNESGVDLILRATSEKYPDANLLADELVEKINKGDLSGLGWK